MLFWYLKLLFKYAILITLTIGILLTIIFLYLNNYQNCSIYRLEHYFNLCIIYHINYFFKLDKMFGKFKLLT